MQTIRFDLHGTFCGKTGPEPCRERRRINGERFVVPRTLVTRYAPLSSRIASSGASMVQTTPAG